MSDYMHTTQLNRFQLLYRVNADPEHWDLYLGEDGQPVTLSSGWAATVLARALETDMGTPVHVVHPVAYTLEDGGRRVT